MTMDTAPSDFDREWRLEELLDSNLRQRVLPLLGELLGAEPSLSDPEGRLLAGPPPGDAPRQALILELEPVGYLHCPGADGPSLRLAARLLQQQLRVQMRYLMASGLHLDAVAEDYRMLRLEHARLQESEQRYKTLAAELEARVAAQVAQLEERRQMLYEAERLASVGLLAAGVAHEINNPLGFLHSNLSSFQRYLERFGQLRERLAEGQAAWDALDLDFILEDCQDLIDVSLNGAERIARIVAELKAFSHVDRSNEEFTDLNVCLRHAASMADTLLPPGVSVALDLLPLPPLVCLPGHINQMLLNLLRNAGQAIADAGRSGSVRISSEADAQGITIRIRDDGVGMSEEQLAHAFDPFYTTRPVGSGAGLGLTSARNIVRAHSGRIELDSRPDLGTTVTLFFPVPQ